MDSTSPAIMDSGSSARRALARQRAASRAIGLTRPPAVLAQPLQQQPTHHGIAESEDELAAGLVVHGHISKPITRARIDDRTCRFAKPAALYGQSAGSAGLDVVQRRRWPLSGDTVAMLLWHPPGPAPRHRARPSMLA